MQISPVQPNLSNAIQAQTIQRAVTPIRQTDSLENVPAIEAIEGSEGTPENAPKAEEVLSPKLVAMARREKALRRQAQELAKEREAWKAKEAEYASNYIPKNSFMERLKADPMGVLNEQGISYDQIVAAALNASPQDQTLQQLKAEIKELREGQKKTLTQAEEQTKQNYDQAVNQIRIDAKLLVDGNADYETIRETDSSEAVVELITKTWEEEKVLLSIEDAAKEVEEFLLERAIKMAQLKKVQARLAPAQPVVEEVPVAPIAKQAMRIEKIEKPVKTLTHAGTPHVSKPLTARERAIAKFNGQQL